MTRWALVLGLLVLDAWIGLAPMTAVPDALPASAPEAAFSAGAPGTGRPLPVAVAGAGRRQRADPGALLG